MNIKQLKELIADLPDDMEVFAEDTETSHLYRCGATVGEVEEVTLSDRVLYVYSDVYPTEVGTLFKALVIG